MVVSDQVVEVTVEDLSDPRAIVASDMVMGNGTADDIQDIVFVRPDKFSPLHTPAIAQELESINRELRDQKRPFLLIGFGRWGSSHPSLGIPVDWSQISGARAIVEATLPEMNVELSQGSHFFHNLSSFRASYFMVQHGRQLRNQLGLAQPQPVVYETEFIRHVRPTRGSRSASMGGPREESSCRRCGNDTSQGETVKPDETQFGTMLHALQERAKELNCLYQVGEFLSQSTGRWRRFSADHRSPAARWQYPHDCQARIIFEKLTIQPSDFQATPWVQKASIVVQGETLERSKSPTGKRCHDRTKARSSRKSAS